MKLSKRQQTRFWREWAAACRANAWTDAEGVDNADREWHRKALLGRAGFASLKEVTRVGGFDAVLQELAALTRPGDLDEQMRLAGNGKRVLIHSILHHRSGDYWKGIAADRWRAIIGKNPVPGDLENLTESDLMMLRSTVAARWSGRVSVVVASDSEIAPISPP